MRTKTRRYKKMTFKWAMICFISVVLLALGLILTYIDNSMTPRRVDRISATSPNTGEDRDRHWRFIHCTPTNNDCGRLN